MRDAPHTVLRPSPGTTPEQVRNARARAWAFVFACFEKHQQENKGGPVTAPDDAEESENDRTTTAIIQED
jgi:hypothetical protein